VNNNNDADNDDVATTAAATAGIATPIIGSADVVVRTEAYRKIHVLAEMSHIFVEG
jgi:hypothetical protein